MTPDAMGLQQALSRCQPLARLRDLLAQSEARFAVIRPALPAVIVAHVKPGPVDDLGWSLLAANASVAAKLRQLQPLLEDSLRAAGFAVPAIRVKVRSA